MSDPRRRVVVIDDAADIRLLLRIALEHFGQFEVVAEAADGRAGIEAVIRERPDVVLIDLAMPVMDGLEALPAVRASVPDATIVVLSGFEAIVMTDIVREAGADDYLQKGLPPQEIAARLTALSARAPEGAP